MNRWLMLVISLLLAGLALTACGDSTSPSTSAGSGGNDVHITLGSPSAEMTITSDVTTFAKGKTYHFIVVNNGKMQHEFEIAKKVHANATEAEHDAASLKELQRIDPGKTQTLDYTFTDAYPAGTLEFECGMPGHYDKGQHTDVTVTA